MSDRQMEMVGIMAMPAGVSASSFQRSDPALLLNNYPGIVALPRS
jgi:hypothetical protein